MCNYETMLEITVKKKKITKHKKKKLQSDVRTLLTTF